MPYTDIWRCKKCNVLPDIQMIGRHFLIACQTCNDNKSIESDSVDDVVSRWNKLHEPPKERKGLAGWFHEAVDTVKGFVEYKCDCFRQSRELKERLQRTVMDLREAEEKEDSLQEPMNLSAEPKTN